MNEMTTGIWILITIVSFCLGAITFFIIKKYSCKHDLKLIENNNIVRYSPIEGKNVIVGTSKVYECTKCKELIEKKYTL